MNPLKCILIGMSADLATEIEAVLRKQGAEIDSQFADLDAALTAMPPSIRSGKYLFAVHIRGQNDLLALHRLCDGYPDKPVLVVAELAAEGGFALEAIRIGAAQVVPLPLTGNELRHAIERIARQFGFQALAGQVIAVTGVSEGCGATTVAINLANEIACGTKRAVILTEIGIRMGRLAAILDITPQYTTEDLLLNLSAMDANNVQRALANVKDRFSVLPGPYKSLAATISGLPELERLLGYLRRCADVIILDMPYTFDDLYFGLIGCADQLVLVTEQKVPSIHAMMVVRDALRSRGHMMPQHLVLNRYSSDYPGASLAEIKSLLKVDDLLLIHSDGLGVMTSLNQGKPLRDAAPHSPVLGDVDRLVNVVLHEPVSEPPHHLGRDILHKLGHLIGRD